MLGSRTVKTGLLILLLASALLVAACNGGSTEGTRNEQGTPIALIDTNEEMLAFLNKVLNRQQVGPTCSYDPLAGVADCGTNGRYQLTPPVKGEGVDCRPWTVEELPVALVCDTTTSTRAQVYFIQFPP